MYVDVCAVYVTGFMVIPAVSAGAPYSVTVVHRPAVPGAAPLAQYPKVSTMEPGVAAVPGFGIYVNVPFAQRPGNGFPGIAPQVTMPLVGPVAS